MSVLDALLEGVAREAFDEALHPRDNSGRWRMKRGIGYVTKEGAKWRATWTRHGAHSEKLPKLHATQSEAVKAIEAAHAAHPHGPMFSRSGRAPSTRGAFERGRAAGRAQRARERAAMGENEDTPDRVGLLGVLLEGGPLREETGAKRSTLSDSDFVYPKERKYRIDDIEHARAALARAADPSNFGDEATVRAAVYKRYPELKKKGGAGGKSS